MNLSSTAYCMLFLLAVYIKTGFCVTPDGFWPLNHIYGGQDISGNGNHAELNNTEFLSGPQELGSDSTAVHFKGTLNSYAKITNKGLLEFSSFTYFAYIYIPSAGSSGPLMYWVHPQLEEQGDPIQVYANDQQVNLNFGGGQVWDQYSLNKGSWIAFSISYNYSTGNVKFWSNGFDISKTLSRQNGVVPRNFSGGFTIAVALPVQCASCTNGFLDAKVTCMQLYDKVLNNEEINEALEMCNSINSRALATDVSSQRSKSYFSPPNNDNCLKANQISVNKTVGSEQECGLNCLSTMRCNSFNFAQQEEQNSFSCELSTIVLGTFTEIYAEHRPGCKLYFAI